MDKQSPYREDTAESHWAGVHFSNIGVINTVPLSEDDIRNLGMLEYVIRLPLSRSDYGRLPESERDRFSVDHDLALQPYYEFKTEYEAGIDEMSPTVHDLLPKSVLSEAVRNGDTTVARYLTDEGRKLLDRETLPEEWTGYVDQERFANEATVLYAQTQDDLKGAEPQLAIINLKLGRWNQYLESWEEGMERQEEHQGRMVERLEEMADRLEESS